MLLTLLLDDEVKLRLRANVTNTAVRRRGEVKTDINAYKKGSNVAMAELYLRRGMSQAMIEI